MPVSLRTTQAAGVAPSTAGFVLPLGATLNMDGSALYHAVMVLFIATLSGLELSLLEYGLLVGLVLLSSAGTAGIPGGGMVMMVLLLSVIGVPTEFIGIYLLVDRFLDMPITSMNVWGDLLGARVIHRFAASIDTKRAVEYNATT